MKEKTISAKQAGMLSVMLILSNKILLLPSLLFEDTGADGFFVMLLLVILDLFVLGIFYLIKSRFHDFSFTQILEKYLGKTITKIIIFAFLIFFFLKSLLTYTVSHIYLKQQVYQDEFDLLALVCFLPVVNHAVIKGLRTISRTVEMFFYLIFAAIVICLFISINNNAGVPLFFQTTAEKYFSSAFKHIFAFGDYLLLFFIMDRINFKEGEGRKIFKTVLAGIILLIAIFASFYSIFRITAFMHNNALSDIISVSVQYSSVGRLDIISMLTIMLLTFFQLEIFVFAFSDCFQLLFPKLKVTHSLIIYDILFFIFYYALVSNYDNFINSAETYLPYLIIVLNYLLPLLLSIFALKRGKGRQYEKIF